MYLYFTLVICFYYFVLKQNQSLLQAKKYWLLTFIVLFALVIIAPALPGHFERLISTQKIASTKTLINAEEKVESYRRVAIEGTARTSMWKSAVPWIKDYWLLGSGPDTIKYLYPKYRLTEYGILEGGHNYTPDRLHNEYLNTLATRGIPAFIIYYVGIIIGWFLLILSSMYQEKNNPLFYINASFLAGVTINLGQVMFNFGVVATLFIFYVLMGLGIAISKNSAFKED
jgi:putative inorganic carbon (HCO3(-)) transporter